ncbi:hypothetical protein FIBSPDRAFT_122779 [Athelia psychrophila]|uniref:Secreted protein n=1 Tax=Athelia psychrophila TaxID=1759441 RepID=A0A166CM14_9AGAM|nr:hypothetical protein FIBSPDRAFT_122779 [Fibularhizoctonia sp. CBS 109695]
MYFKTCTFRVIATLTVLLESQMAIYTSTIHCKLPRSYGAGPLSPRLNCRVKALNLNSTVHVMIKELFEGAETAHLKVSK